jgi:hypothetical protein
MSDVSEVLDNAENPKHQSQTYPIDFYVLKYVTEKL